MSHACLALTWPQAVVYRSPGLHSVMKLTYEHTSAALVVSFARGAPWRCSISMFAPSYDNCDIMPGNIAHEVSNCKTLREDPSCL